MKEEFRPSLSKLEGFEGKIKVDYNEYTQYLTLVLAEEGKALSFSGIVNDQEHVDAVVESMLSIVKPTKKKKK